MVKNSSSETAYRSTVTTDKDSLHTQLASGMTDLGLTYTPAQMTELLSYIELLAKWNRTYNLTAIRDPLLMVSHHILDSLAAMPYIVGPKIADIGTGPGLPGIPLAIMLPDFEWILLDSNGKKTRFVTQAVAELGLANVRVITARVADQHLDVGCNTLISRALSQLSAFISGAGHLCHDDGQLLAMKGVIDTDELKQVPASYSAEPILLLVPSLDAQRCIIRLTKNG